MFESVLGALAECIVRRIRATDLLMALRNSQPPYLERSARETWMAETSPAMTKENVSVAGTEILCDYT